LPPREQASKASTSNVASTAICSGVPRLVPSRSRPRAPARSSGSTQTNALGNRCQVILPCRRAGQMS
jgi:hypothetical protein